MPSSRHARTTRTAISPRLAMRTLRTRALYVCGERTRRRTWAGTWTCHAPSVSDVAPPQPLASYQNEIYLMGLGEQRPSWPCNLAALEDEAAASFTPESFGYVAGSAGTEGTARANRAAFDKWQI